MNVNTMDNLTVEATMQYDAAVKAATIWLIASRDFFDILRRAIKSPVLFKPVG